jgi:hypothetical protein
VQVPRRGLHPSYFVPRRCDASHYVVGWHATLNRCEYVSFGFAEPFGQGRETPSMAPGEGLAERCILLGNVYRASCLPDNVTAELLCPLFGA